MLITRLNVNYFGKFTGKEIELKQGINLIYGDNEAGKSTLHTFIRGMLFGIERLRGRGAASKEDTYTRYLPWDYPGAYGGQMDIRLDDRLYRLQRSFHANDKSFTIVDLMTGREIKTKDGHISGIIPGLTESTYRNTISIEQLRAETDAELASQVRNYITNLSIARSREINVEKAVNSLKDQKKALESVPYDAQLHMLSEAIRDGEAKEAKINSLTTSLKGLESKENSLRERIAIHKSPKRQREEEYRNQLPAILEKYRTYQELSRQYSQLNSKVEELQNRVKDQEEYIEDLNNNQGDRTKGAGAKRYMYIALCFALGILSYMLTKSLIIAISFLAGALSIVVVLPTITNKRNQDIRSGEYLKAHMSLEHGNKLLEELTLRRRTLEDSCDDLHDTIMLYMQEYISEDELTYEAIERLQEVISNRKREAAKEESEYNSQLEEYRFQIEKIRWELSGLEENETELIMNREKYEHIMRKQKENKLEIDAVNLAIDSIEELSTSIHDNFGLELNDAVSDIIDRLSNHKYQELKIDERLNIKLGWKDKYIILDRLSAGTIDQVYFALRLAVSDLLLGNEPMPIILDDSFALYDDSRLKAVLESIAMRNQVILFSCQNRERQILEKMGLEFNYIEL